MNCYLGLDPGVSGGLACLYDDDTVEAIKMPDNLESIWVWLSRGRGPGTTYAAVEKVGGWIPGREHMAHGGQPGSRMFELGTVAGALRMALVALGLRDTIDEPGPRAWQKAVGVVRPKGTEYVAWKRMLKDHAQKRFPKLVVTLGTADALLIALYCKQKFSEV